VREAGLISGQRPLFRPATHIVIYPTIRGRLFDGQNPGRQGQRAGQRVAHDLL